MKTWIRKSLKVGVLSAGILLAAASTAQAGTTQVADGNDGVLNGNQIDIPIQVPINVCGNGIAVLLALGLGNADCVSPVTHDNDNDVSVDVDKGRHGHHHHGRGGDDYKSDRSAPGASNATSTAAPTTGRTSLLGSLPKLAQPGKTIPLGVNRGSEAVPATAGDQYTVQGAPAAAPATQPSLLSGLKNSKMNIGGLDPSELLAPVGQSAA